MFSQIQDMMEGDIPYNLCIWSCLYTYCHSIGLSNSASSMLPGSYSPAMQTKIFPSPTWREARDWICDFLYAKCVLYPLAIVSPRLFPVSGNPETLIHPTVLWGGHRALILYFIFQFAMIHFFQHYSTLQIFHSDSRSKAYNFTQFTLVSIFLKWDSLWLVSAF